MNILGLTVGVGAHTRLAQEAASRFEQCTGLQTTILGDREYAESGCLNPSLMRTYAFDYVDADVIVYFDADIMFCRMWNPSDFVDGRLRVVRDITYAPHVLLESMNILGVAATDYFNAGLMIMHRHHADFLRVARRLTERTILDASPFMEQTALNQAAQIMDVELGFMPRALNWLVTAGKYIAEGVPIVGAHKWVSRQPADAQLESAQPVIEEHAPLYLYEELTGIYMYNRVGHDQRMLELLPDGSIGRGRSRMEWWWVPDNTGGQVSISIHGYTSHADRSEILTVRVSETAQGVYRGVWTMFEKMPIELTRTDRWEARKPPYGRARVLERLLEGVRNPRMAEIGVYKGETAAYLAGARSDLNILAVDTWSAHHAESEYAKTVDYIAGQTQERHTRNMWEALQALSPYGDRIRIRRTSSYDAHKNSPGSLFDLVFLDGDHSYAAVRKDIDMWRRRVRPGGVLAGHDYNQPTTNGTNFGPQVKRAVDEFVQANNLELHLEDDYVWWVRL